MRSKSLIFYLLTFWVCAHVLYCQQTDEKRVALVIGNGAYKNQSPLKNTLNDAEDISAMLQSLGFQVTKKINADRIEMRQAIREFGKNIIGASVGFFYYSGHGMQVKGRNFLIPVNTDIQTEDEVVDEAVDAGLVLRKMEKASCRINIVILDACRNNPFARSFRSAQTGLAQMDAPTGSLLVYATAPGKTAEDGRGRNGTFTKYLLKHIKTPNLELGQMLKKITRDVVQETSNGQIPWRSSSLIDDFYFCKKNKIEPLPSAQSSGKACKIKVINPTQKSTIHTDETVEFSGKVYDRDGKEQQKSLLWQVIGSSKGNKFGPKFAFQSSKPGDFILKATEPESGISQIYLITVKAADIPKTDKSIGQIKKDNRHPKSNKNINVRSYSGRQVVFTYLRTANYSAGRASHTVEEYLHEQTGMEFVLLPGGTYTMGFDAPIELFKGPAQDELPPRQVKVAPFLISKHEVTQKVWLKIMGTKLWEQRKGPYTENGPDYPVVYVKWKEAKKFAEKLGLQLPSEAQWEYACKAGTTSRYYWGAKTDDDYVWCMENTWYANMRNPQPVGQKEPNAFGLYDMMGNVGEWCLDTHQKNYEGAPLNDKPWIDPENKINRVYRGGSFTNKLHEFYSANRWYFSAKATAYFIGFRLCYSLEK